MGILINSYFINLDDCENYLRDIVYTNFYYYVLIENYPDDIVIMKNRCRTLLENRIHQIMNDKVWDGIWEIVFNSIIRCNSENYLYL